MDLSLDPQFVQMTARLTEVAARNTAETVRTRIRTVKAAKKDQETIAELEQIIFETQEERAELLQIAQALKEQLAGQTISDANVTYITTRLLPKVKEFVDQLPDDKVKDKAAVHEVLDASGALLSTETLTVMQLLGFNFKRAIGEPLTDLIATSIRSRAKEPSPTDTEVNLESTRLQRACAELAQNDEAFKRFRQLFPEQTPDAG